MRREPVPVAAALATARPVDANIFPASTSYKTKKSKSNYPDFLGLKLTSVLLTLDESVKLKDGFFGICESCFPQYLIKAILLGASQDVK